MIPTHVKALAHYARNPAEISANLARWRRRERIEAPFIFVLGPPRSGTTLLHRILLNHSKIRGFSEETGTFSPRSIHDYRRFSEFLSPEIHSAALRQTRSISGFFHAIHDLSLPLPDGGAFVEKTPQHAIYLPYLLKCFPKARAVFAIRDPRDTFCSGLSAGNIPQARNLTKHARYFRRCVSPLLTLPETDRERVFILKYEDFTRAPEAELTEVMRFLRLSGEEASQLSPEAMASDSRAQQGAFARLARPITPATVNRWQREMTPEQAQAYQIAAGPGLSHFGYASA